MAERPVSEPQLTAESARLWCMLRCLSFVSLIVSAIARAHELLSPRQAWRYSVAESTLFLLILFLCIWTPGCETGYEGKSTQEWISALADSNPGIREHAEAVLLRIWCGAVPEMTKALYHHRDAHVRGSLAKLLPGIINGTLGEPESFPEAIAALAHGATADTAAEVRQSAELGLEMILRCDIEPSRPGMVTAALVGVIDQCEDHYARARAAQLLAYWACQRRLPNPEAVVPSIVSHLRNDPAPEVRQGAAEVLYCLGPVAEDALYWLGSSLTLDPSPQARGAAAKAIGNIGPAGSVRDRAMWLTASTLGEAAVNDSSADVRSEAARAVGWIAFRGGRYASAAVPRLSAALRRDVDPAVRVSAATALGVVATLLSGANDKDTPLSRSVRSKGERRVSFLSKMNAHDKATTLAIIEDLGATVVSDPKPAVRRVAAEELGRIGPAAASATALLRRALNDPEYEVQNAAREALAEIGGGKER